MKSEYTKKVEKFILQCSLKFEPRATYFIKERVFGGTRGGLWRRIYSLQIDINYDTERVYLYVSGTTVWNFTCFTYRGSRYSVPEFLEILLEDGIKYDKKVE